MGTDRTAIDLTRHEVIEAAVAGILRHVESKALDRADAYGAESGDAWAIDIEGACGERAVAKYLDRYWAGKGTFRGGDVGPWQVRTAATHTGSLILRPGDRDADVFILVTGKAPAFRVRGWVRGFEGKARGEWRDPHGRGGAWFVPVARLHPMESLPCDPRPVPATEDREPGEDG